MFYDRACLNDIGERWVEDIKDQAARLRMNFQLVWLHQQIKNARLIAGERNKEELEEYFEKLGMPKVQPRSKRDEFYLKRMNREKAKKETRVEA